MTPAAPAADCKHGIPEASCSVCKHGQAVARERFSPQFTARYDGWCRNCDERFEAGDEIRQSDMGHYVHAECGVG